MISKGFFEDSSDLHLLKDSLVKVLDLSQRKHVKRKSDAPRHESVLVNAIKLQVLENLELLLGADLNAQITEFFSLQVSMTSSANGRQALSKGGHFVADHSCRRIMANEPLNRKGKLCGMRVSLPPHTIGNSTTIEGTIRMVNSDIIRVDWDEQLELVKTLKKGGESPREQKYINEFQIDDSNIQYIRFPRLRALLSDEYLKNSSKDCLILAQSSLKDLSKSAMRYYMLSHSSMDKFSRCLDSVCLLSIQEQQVYTYLQNKVFFLSTIKLDDSLTISSKNVIERALQGIRFAIEGRTEGVIPDSNMVLTNGPDWQLSGTSDSLYPVLGVQTLSNGKYKITIKLANSQKKCTFGSNGVFELALPNRVRRLQKRYQTIAMKLDLPGAILSILQQERVSGADNTIDCNSVFSSCYAILNALIFRNPSIKSTLCSNSELSLIMARHISKNYGAQETLSQLLNENMFRIVSTPLLRSIFDLITSCVSEKSRTDTEAMKLIKVLSAMIPITELTNKFTVEDRKILLQTKVTLGKYLLQLDILNSLLTFVLSSDLNQDAIAFSMSEISLGLLDILAKCAYCNSPMKKLIFEKYSSLTFASLNRALLIISEFSYGFKSRAQLMRPWTRFMTSLYVVQSVEHNDLSSFSEKVLLPDASFYLGKEDNSNGKSVIVESRHPYAVNTDSVYDVSVPSAQFLKLYFSRSTALYSDVIEGTHDFVQVWRKQPATPAGARLYQVVNPLGLRAFSANRTKSIASPSAIVPVGTVLSVDMREWHHGGDPDPQRKNPDGYYRAQISSPAEYSSMWVDLIIPRVVIPCDLQGRPFRQMWSPRSYSRKNFPFFKNELYIQGNEFSIYFHSGEIMNEWGWKLIAAPCSQEEYLLHGGLIQSYLYEASVTRTGSQVFEWYASEYVNDGEHNIKIDFPADVSGVEIVFDSCSSTERYACSLSFVKNLDQASRFGDAQYGGSCFDSNWPGVNGKAPLYVPANSFNCIFKYVSGKNFGFRFVAYPVPPPPQGFDKLVAQANASLVQSNHKPWDAELAPLDNDECVYDFSSHQNEFVMMDYFVPLGQIVRIERVQVLNNKSYCRLAAGTRLYIGFGGHVASCWDNKLSCTELNFGLNDGVVQRKAKISAGAPAALCRVIGRKWQIAIRILQTSLDDNSRLSFGAAIEDFSNRYSQGFGNTAGSWGLVCYRKDISRKTFFMYNGIEVETCRELRVDDVIIFRLDLDEGKLSFVIRSVDFYYQYTFKIQPNEFPLACVGGVTIGEQYKIQLIKSRAVGISRESVLDLSTENDSSVERRNSVAYPKKEIWLSASGIKALNPMVEEHVIKLKNLNEENGMAIAFHPSIYAGSMGAYDLLQLSKSEIFSPELDLLNNRPWPMVESMLNIDAQTAYLRYTRLCPYAYGFQLVAIPATLPKDPFADYMRIPSKYRILESQHNYADNLDYTEQVSIPGAKNIVIIFDPRSSTEESWDYIQFRKETGSSETWPDENGPPDNKYSGGRNSATKVFPGIDKIEPLTIPSDHFEFYFHSDSSNNDWGWRFIAFDQSILDSDYDESTTNAPGKHNPMKVHGDDLFFFFENRSTCVQTIKIDMPVMKGSAYFEIIMNTSSNLQSCTQIGCAIRNDVAPIAQLSHFHTHKLPLCLGLGSVRGTYAIDGIEDPLTISSRYCAGSDASKPYVKVEFRKGTVVGVLMDLEGGKIYYHINGASKGQAFTQDLGLSWRLCGGICPAFSFCPGQAVSVNVGQRPFFGEGAKYWDQSVLTNYSSRGTGAALVWNARKAQWGKCGRGSEVIENNHDDEAVLSYSVLIAGVLGDLQNRNLLTMEESFIIDDESNAERIIDLNNTLSKDASWAPGTLVSSVAKNSNGVVLVTSFDLSLSSRNLIFSNTSKTVEMPVGSSRGISPLSLAKTAFSGQICAFHITLDKIIDDCGFNEFSFGFSSSSAFVGPGDKKFGEAKKSWGFISDNSLNATKVVFEGVEIDRIDSLRVGDTISVVCDSEQGYALLAINDGEYLKKFSFSSLRNNVCGVSLSSGQIVSVSTELPSHLLALLDEDQPERDEDQLVADRVQTTDILSSSLRDLMATISEKRLNRLGLKYPPLKSYEDGQDTSYSLQGVKKGIEKTLSSVTQQVSELDRRMQEASSISVADWLKSQKEFLDNLDNVIVNSLTLNNKKSLRPWLRRPIAVIDISQAQQIVDGELAEIMNDQKLVRCWDMILSGSDSPIGEEEDLAAAKAPLDTAAKEKEISAARRASNGAQSKTGVLSHFTMNDARVYPQPEDVEDPGVSPLLQAAESGDILIEEFDALADASQGFTSTSNAGPLLCLVDAVLDPGIFDRTPSFVKLVSKFLLALGRSVPKTLSSKSLTLAASMRAISTNDGADFDDLYDSDKEMEVLSMIHRAYVKIGAIPLCIQLLSQTSRPYLQDLGVELSNYLLLNALALRDKEESADSDGNKGMQGLFMQALSTEDGDKVGRALGQRLLKIAEELSSKNGKSSLQELDSAQKIMEFLQKLCGKFILALLQIFAFILATNSDGQYEQAQNYCRNIVVRTSNKDSQADVDFNLISCVVEFLSVAADGIATHLSVDDISDSGVLYLLSATNQCLSTLTDMLQVKMDMCGCIYRFIAIKVLLFIVVFRLIALFAIKYFNLFKCHRVLIHRIRRR